MSYIKDITKEKWYSKKDTIYSTIDRQPIAKLSGAAVYFRGTAETLANAQLLTEAGNIANQTGLSPRELLEQRDELLRVLKMAMYEIKDWHEYNYNQIDSFDNNEKDMQIDVANDILNKLEQIKSTINKSTNTPPVNQSSSAEGEKK